MPLVEFLKDTESNTKGQRAQIHSGEVDALTKSKTVRVISDLEIDHPEAKSNAPDRTAQGSAPGASE